MKSPSTAPHSVGSVFPSSLSWQPKHPTFWPPKGLSTQCLNSSHTHILGSPWIPESPCSLTTLPLPLLSHCLECVYIWLMPSAQWWCGLGSFISHPPHGKAGRWASFLEAHQCLPLSEHVWHCIGIATCLSLSPDCEYLPIQPLWVSTQCTGTQGLGERCLNKRMSKCLAPPTYPQCPLSALSNPSTNRLVFLSCAQISA